jgi:hypothetical protein
MDSIKRLVFAINLRQFFLCFSAVWILISVLQSIFTELLGDEAYYIYTVKNLVWGYFGHPPATITGTLKILVLVLNTKGCLFTLSLDKTNYSTVKND